MAEAGLNVENEFAEMDDATSKRMSREAAAVAQAHRQDVTGEMEHG